MLKCWGNISKILRHNAVWKWNGCFLLKITDVEYNDEVKEIVKEVCVTDDLV